MSNNVILEAKPIGKIKGRFFIPTYQRGYRWTKSQVSTLLNLSSTYKCNFLGADNKQ